MQRIVRAVWLKNLLTLYPELMEATYDLFDWHRIFIGDVPGSFYIEVIIRTVIIYTILIFAIRLMGKRMALQLNVSEMAAMVTLAAAIGIPIQAPDKGILPAVVIAFVVVVTERILSQKAFNNSKVEKVIDGDITVLIENSVLKVETLQQSGMSRLLIFEQVRAHGFHHLGQVKRMYLESSGAFSIVKDETEKPGLSVIPTDDQEYWQEDEKQQQIYVCGNCGAAPGSPELDHLVCSVCNKGDWETAVL
jgi:uncharacterized membrane protein YcaP (DUF421 family)